MICVECGVPSTFWLCSNACALAFAEKRRNMKCAICSFNPKTGRIGRHDTNRICAACKARPENAGWTSARREEPDDAVETRLEEHERFVTEQDRPLPAVTARTIRIANMIVGRERVAVPYRDRQGRKRGVRYRWRDYTVRRIAEKEGCPKSAVEDVIESVEN